MRWPRAVAACVKLRTGSYLLTVPVIHSVCPAADTVQLGLPDLPYFTGDPVFQLRSPASRKEAARETESPVFHYRLIQIGRIYKLCDSNLHHAAWCDEHKSFYAANTLLRSAYFCRNSTLFGPRCLII